MRLIIRRLNFHVKELVYRNIEGKKILFLFILTNLVYVFMLQVTIPQVLSFSGGMKIFDLMPTGYEPEYAVSLLKKLGVEGRNAYLYHQIPVDLIYPFLFGITYCLFLAYFLNKLNSLKAEYFYLCLLPLMAGVFDYLENLGIIQMLVTYPHLSSTAIQITAFFTVMKSLLSAITFMVLFVVLILFGVKKLSRKK